MIEGTMIFSIFFFARLPCKKRVRNDPVFLESIGFITILLAESITRDV